MDRDEALVQVSSIGLNRVMALAGRDLTDTPTGFGPALDRAFAAYIMANSLDSSVTTTTVATADSYGFSSLLRAVSYDLILPEIAVLIDTSVDAPLSSAKYSQMFRAFQQLRADAWKECAVYGYGGEINAGGYKTNLDFREPSGVSAGVAEYE